LPQFGRLGGQLGVGLALAGFVVIFLGWNGAAGNDTVLEQTPYLVSGGMAGLGLIVLGAAMILVDNQRKERARVEALLTQLVAATRSTAPSAGSRSRLPEGYVVAGDSSYHRPGCRLVDGRSDARPIPVVEARDLQLSACRVCTPEE
jgi:hypothetical protein